MQRIGQILKEEREKRRLSLHEVGMSLKINPKVLQAIEDSDEAKLPAKTFLRGFVRSYALFLRLNVEEILELFQNEMGSTKPKPQVLNPLDPAITDVTSEKPDLAIVKDSNASASAPAPEKKPTSSPSAPQRSRPTESAPSNSPINQNQIVVGLVVIILAITIFIVSKLIDRYQKEKITQSTEEIAAPIERPAETAPITDATTKSEDSTENATKDSAPVYKNEVLASKTIPLFPGVAEKLEEQRIAETAPPPAQVQTAPTSPFSDKKPEAKPIVEQKMPEPKPLEPKPVAKVIETKPAETKPTDAKPSEAKPADAKVSANSTSAINSIPKPSAQNEDVKKTDETVKKLDPNTTDQANGLQLIKPTEVILEAFNKVQIRYHFGDSNWQNIELSPGAYHTFKSQSNLQIEVSDGGSVSLIVNGRDRGVPGQIGKPITLSYPK